ncbi:GreA/GreB family elongation factor [Marinagarivorans cellulosilyticus]|uniref:GreA/GreB family elongation factor n=1 Tax=Marinagarivorans cellulosilyticus TaxID=2721545 RepID=UPI003B8304BA
MQRFYRPDLVYPYERDKEKSISILTPAGSALIGLSVGQRIEWSLTQNSAPTTVTVKSVSN